MIAVVGAAGFLGSHMVELLRRKNKKVAGFDVTLNEFADEAIDVTWSKENVVTFLKSVRPDAIINFAGLLGTHELFDDVESAIKVNILGQYNVAYAAAQLEVPYVTIEQPHVWQNPYETTRGAGVRLARGLAEHKGLRLATVQAFNAFGPRQAHGPGHPQKIFPTFALAAMRGEPIEIYGSGAQSVNMVHAKDIAEIAYAALNHAVPGRDTPHFYGAAENGNMSVNDVATKIQRFTQFTEVKHLPMRDGETDDDLGAAAVKGRLYKQAQLLGVRTGLTDQQWVDTISWYRQFV